MVELQRLKEGGAATKSVLDDLIQKTGLKAYPVLMSIHHFCTYRDVLLVNIHLIAIGLAC